MNFFKRILKRWQDRRKARKLIDQAGKLDVRKQELERQCRKHRNRVDELRKAAIEAKEAGETGKLDDLLSTMKEVDGKLRNANFLLNNIDKKRDKILKAVQILETAADDVFSGEDIDFDTIEDLDAEIAIKTEDLELDHRRVSRLNSTVSDSRERFSDSQRDDLLQQFDMEPGITLENDKDRVIHRDPEPDSVDEMEKLFEESKKCKKESPGFVESNEDVTK